jgi:ribosomal protein L11 methyltransferase
MLLAALDAFDPALDWSRARFRNVADQDWERAWMDQYVPLSFGARTWIVPWNRELPEDAQSADAAVVRLDPGLAFGSGTHPTTRCACNGSTRWPKPANSTGARCSISVAARASSRSLR